MSSPRDTSKISGNEATGVLAAMLLTGDPTRVIHDMEAAGQRELVQSSVLPSEILHSTQEEFEALGFVFGDVVDGDPLFREVALPEGWKRQGSEHAMWSHIVDERGVERVAIFYKAAYYDRKAHMSIDNVGYGIAQKHVYGDGDLSLRDDLTADELAANIEA